MQSIDNTMILPMHRIAIRRRWRMILGRQVELVTLLSILCQFFTSSSSITFFKMCNEPVYGFSEKEMINAGADFVIEDMSKLNKKIEIINDHMHYSGI